MKYELFYSSGGHEGPYHSLDDARDRATRLLAGCKNMSAVYIAPRDSVSPGGFGKPVLCIQRDQLQPNGE